MEFKYVIIYHAVDGLEITRHGEGVFYPTDVRAFKMEDMLWQIAEDHDVRPDSIEIFIQFTGGNIGTQPKHIEGPKAATAKDEA